MKNQKEIDIVKNEFSRINPKKSVDKLPSNDCGINFIIKHLASNGGEAFTYEISKEMNASTARVSSLINKLEERGYVERKVSSSDARRTLLVLTQEGKDLHKKMEYELDLYISKLIDKLGLDELLRFLHTLEIMNETVVERIEEKNKEDK